jgi:thiol-disulfide isomerase/thioredoxin
MKFISLEENTANAVSLEQFNSMCKDSHVIVMYYANWSGWSKKLKPEWKKLLKILKNKYAGNFIMAEVDSDSMRNLPQEFDHNIRGFPTTLYLVNGERKGELNGGAHSVDDFEKWLKSSDVLGDRLVDKSTLRSPPPLPPRPPRTPHPSLAASATQKPLPPQHRAAPPAQPHSARQFVANNQRSHRFKLGWNR